MCYVFEQPIIGELIPYRLLYRRNICNTFIFDPVLVEGSGNIREICTGSFSALTSKETDSLLVRSGTVKEAAVYSVHHFPLLL